MVDGNSDLKDLLATARAIHFAYQQGAITYQEAKQRSRPLLLRINKSVCAIAKKFKVKPRLITFSDLGRNI